MPIDQDSTAITYYKHLHSQIRDQLSTLISIKSAIDQLLAAQRPFIMTWTDYLLWEKQTLCLHSMEFLQEQIRPYLCDFEGLNFLDWSQRKGFDISPTLHPLEQAHQSAAEHMLTHWDHYIRS